jgi:probable HAF family extracellular repeat protein
MKSALGLLVVVCAVGSGAGRAHAQTGSFNLTGFAPGTAGSFAYAVSANGEVAAGFSVSSSGPNPGYTWTASGVRLDFGLQPGLPASTQASALSGDGSVVAGTAWNTPSATQAFRWSGPGTFQTLGVLPTYTRSYGEGVSGNGSVVVGHCLRANPTQGQAFRWTQSGGMQGLGFARPGDAYSDAAAISRDAGTIVGASADPGGGFDAFIWTAAGGMRPLPQLPGTPGRASGAAGVNFDGSIIVGDSGADGRAAIWRNGQVSQLDSPPGFGFGTALGVSDDGNVAVGAVQGGGLPAGTIAAVWTPALGPELLQDYLARYGVSPPSGWSLRNCYAVSADGRVFAGTADGPIAGPGLTQGFVATIPAPGIIAVFALAGLGSLRRGR